MDWQQAFLARLLAAPSFVAIVGTDADGDPSAAWLTRPQGDAFPGLTLQEFTPELAQHLKGIQGLQPVRVQVDAWGLDYASAKALLDVAITILVPSATDNGFTFTRALVEGPRDLPDREAEQPVFRRSADLIFHHIEN